MNLLRNKAFYFAILLVVLGLCTEQADARRKALSGRRTMTREQYRGLPIPAWSIVLIMAITYLIIGTVVYFALRKVILQSPVENVNSYTPAMMDDNEA